MKISEKNYNIILAVGYMMVAISSLVLLTIKAETMPVYEVLLITFVSAATFIRTMYLLLNNIK